MPDDEFSANLPKWLGSIRAGKLKPDQIIANLSTKYALTDAQKADIAALVEQPGE